MKITAHLTIKSGSARLPLVTPRRVKIGGMRLADGRYLAQGELVTIGRSLSLLIHSASAFTGEAEFVHCVGDAGMDGKIAGLGLGSDLRGGFAGYLAAIAGDHAYFSGVQGGVASVPALVQESMPVAVLKPAPAEIPTAENIQEPLSPPAPLPVVAPVPEPTPEPEPITEPAPASEPTEEPAPALTTEPQPDVVPEQPPVGKIVVLTERRAENFPFDDTPVTGLTVREKASNRPPPKPRPAPKSPPAPMFAPRVEPASKPIRPAAAQPAPSPTAETPKVGSITESDIEMF